MFESIANTNTPENQNKTTIDTQTNQVSTNTTQTKDLNVDTSGLLNNKDIKDNTPPKSDTLPTGSVEQKGDNIKITKPEEISEDLWDEDKGNLKTDKILELLNNKDKQIKDFRRLISKGTKAPEKVEDYEYEPTKDVAELNLNLDEKLISGVKEVAYKNGLSQEQFNNFMNGYFGMLKEKGFLEKQKSKEELDREATIYKETERKKLGSNPDLVVNGVESFIRTQYKNGTLNEEEAKMLVEFADKSANNLLLVNKIRLMTGEKEVPILSAVSDGLPSDEQIGREWNSYTPEQKSDIMEKRIKAGREPNIPAHFFK